MISPVKVWRRKSTVRGLLGREGEIVTWTKIIVAGTEYKKSAPYPVVLVRLKGGTKVFGQLVDYHDEDLKMGQRVVSTLRKVREPTDEGVIAYGVKFRPIS